jgi:hypothetical protein
MVCRARNAPYRLHSSEMRHIWLPRISVDSECAGALSLSDATCSDHDQATSMSNRYNPGSRSFLQAATSNASVLGLLTTLRQTLQRSESTVRSLSTAPSAIRGSDAARRLVSSYTNLTNRLQAYLQSPGNVSATALDALARDVNGFAGRSEQVRYI